MIFNKSITSFLILLPVLFISCTNKDNLQSDKTINVYVETEAWKEDLLKDKVIGEPCEYNSDVENAMLDWQNENPDQVDGLPANDNAYHFKLADINNNEKDDVLLYFQADNCTGHNGSTPTFAKIIYSDGAHKDDVLSEIITSIQREFNQLSKENDWEQVTDNYMDNTTTITNYNDGIIGKFTLYTEDDAHCCPSYSGDYKYNVADKKIEIEVMEL